MLLQVAIDRAESFGVIAQVQGIADIIEIGTPLLKRFGIGAIATARELCPDTPVLADTKTVDAGDLEAEMVLAAGARLMTVLSSTSPATHAAVGRTAARFGAYVVVDTITEFWEARTLARGRDLSGELRLCRRPFFDRHAARWRPVIRAYRRRFGYAPSRLPRRPCRRARTADP